MVAKLTYNQKVYGLGLTLVLLIVMGYSLSFSETIGLSQNIKEKETKVEWLRSKERELPAVKRKMEEFEKTYSNNKGGDAREELTSFISQFSEKNGCVVTEIPVNTVYKNNNLHVQTNTYTIKGSYHSLVQLLNQLEKNYNYVTKIMSAKFFSRRDNQSKRKNLYLTLVTQSLINNKTCTVYFPFNIKDLV